MSSKRLLINKADCVDVDIMDGISKTYPGLFVDKCRRIVMLNRERKNRVGLISGGGSGHEPFPAGYVGEGMLTAGVAGKVFASPPTATVLAAIEAVSKLNKGGVLLLILNYTGDVLNFASAMEVARSKGCNVECVIVSDDVAHYATSKGFSERRGLVGVILMAKILGGLSKHKEGLSELVSVGRMISCRMASFGVGYSPCTLPGKTKPLFHIHEDSLEFGLGIHGEVGIAIKPLTSLSEIVKQILVKIMACLLLEDNAKVVAVINNLGAHSQTEMLIISREVHKQIDNMDITLARIYIGTLVSGINMKAFQICLLNITGKEDWLPYLDEETEAFAWPGRKISYDLNENQPKIASVSLDHLVTAMDGMILSEILGEFFRKCLFAVSVAIMDECDKLNELDQNPGDGDCGTSIRHFAEGIIHELHSLPIRSVASTLAMLAKLVESLMDGKLGAILVLFFIGAAQTCESWESCWHGGIEMIYKHSYSRVGDRTVLDALVPAYKGYSNHLKEYGDHCWPNALKIALDRAVQGCEATKTMVARWIRANYSFHVDPSKAVDVDPGAHAVVIVMSTLVQCLVPKGDASCPI